MRLLINLSNHPQHLWMEEQKSYWDKIVFIPFPSVDSSVNTFEVEKLVKEYYRKIVLIAMESEVDELYIMLQGEYTFCYLLHEMLLKNSFGVKVYFAIPTSERKTIEKQLEDGSVEKTSIFQFVRWRIF